MMKHKFAISKTTCKHSTDCGIMSKALQDILNLAFNTDPVISNYHDATAIARKALLDSGYTIAKIPLHQFQEL